MFELKQPSEQAIREFLAEQKNEPFSYREVGHSQQGSPRWFNEDRYRIRLGSGAACFERAIQAIRNWKMFEVGWVQLWTPETPIRVNETVAVVVHHFGFWSLNAARIVYVVDEQDGDLKKFGFAYGTLPAHGERGEERFLVEWNRKDDSVWYEMFAFSRPAPPGMLGYPLTRLLQKQFARDSQLAMVRAVNTDQITIPPSTVTICPVM